jgi:hypothetical protein
MIAWIFPLGVALVVIIGIGRVIAAAKSGKPAAPKKVRLLNGSTYWVCTALHKHRTPDAARQCSAAQNR